MSPDLLIILVHGTWGRGFFPDSRPVSNRKPWWFEPGSEFRQQLANELGERNIQAEIGFIEWSSANSFHQREEAARHLAQNLDQKLSQYPNISIVVVGHSHGGNIIIRALSHFVKPLKQVYIATLATPYLAVFRTEPTSSAAYVKEDA